MARRILFIIIFSGFCLQHLVAQTYVLNEDFTGCTGITPPNQWQNYSLTTEPSDVWHFDNPGNQSIGFPFSGKFAIFDSPVTSNNFLPEESVLESAVFDATNGNYVYLFYDCYFSGQSGDTGWVELYNGATWEIVRQYTSSMTSVSSEMIDVTAQIATIPNAKLRFRWKGNGQNYWAVDNISVFIPIGTDLGIVNLTNPQMPFAAGLQDIKINIKNFGGQSITAFTLNWSANGILQTPLPWTGNLSFSQQLADFLAGEQLFNAGQPVDLKFWVTLPATQADLNHINDTLVLSVCASFCGTYTIGGTNPDFSNFAEVAAYLNEAGVACPVTFLVRDGLYYEQFELYDIPGSSSVNTICFRGENLSNSSATLIKGYSPLNYLVNLSNSSNIKFEYLNFRRTNIGGVSVYIVANSNHISFENCMIASYYGISISSGSDILLNNIHFDGSVSYIYFGIMAGSMNNPTITNLKVQNSTFNNIQKAAISIQNNTDFEIVGNDFMDLVKDAISVQNSSDGEINLNWIDETGVAINFKSVGNTNILGNSMNNFQGISLDLGCTGIVIGENKLTDAESFSAININKTSSCLLRNNFIQGSIYGNQTGIFLGSQNSYCNILFNSVRIENTDQNSSAINIADTVNQLVIQSNILANIGGGYALSASNLNFNADYNNYYSFGDYHFQFQSQEIDSLNDWQLQYPGDTHSKSQNPFFTSVTNLSCNQSLLNNQALSNPTVPTDIDNFPRSASPDMGAREFGLCSVDIGINAFIGLSHNMSAGNHSVVVRLQNHGTSTVTACSIRWKLNGTLQPNYIWIGNLPPGENQLVTLGTFNIVMAQTYTIEAWTLSPNGNADCNPSNDLLKYINITSVLCGTYTIGGSNPDFTTIGEAVQILNTAGISCPVVFLIRNGTYTEQISISTINGADSVNTVCFRGQSLDSSLVLITSSSNFTNYTLGFFNTSWISFEHVSIVRNSSQISNKSIAISNSDHLSFKSVRIFGLTGIEAINSGNFSIENSLFADNILTYMRAGINLVNGANGYNQNFCIKNSSFVNQNMLGIYIQNTEDVIVNNCQFLNIQDGISLNLCAPVDIRENSFNEMLTGINSYQSDLVIIEDNTFDEVCKSISLTKSYVSSTISFNRIQNSYNGYGINLTNSTNSNVYNNFIHGQGVYSFKGISVDIGVGNCKIIHNAVKLNVSNNESAALSVFGASSALTIKNNLFANYGTGNALNMININIFYDFDYNDYWAGQNKLIKLGQTLVNDINNYQLLTGVDLHSLNYNPFYSSNSNLVSNHTLLNNAATYLSSYLFDIDSTMRSATPDMGAREFDICTVDVGINDFIGLEHSMSPGSHDVAVEIQNQGQTTITSCQIHWSVNGINQPTVNWTGSLFPGQHFLVNLSSILVVTGDSYKLKAWTANPNSTGDCNANNDTAVFSPLTTPLCGTFTIGGFNPDFQNFSEAREILEYAGVSCPVVFLIRNGTYNEQLEFGSIQGSNATNTVTFRGESQDSSAVILNYGSSSFDYVVNCKGTAWMNWEYISFSRSYYFQSVCFAFEKSSHDVSFSSCQFLGYQGVNGTLSYNVNFDKCYFAKSLAVTNMEYGIKFTASPFTYSKISVTNSEFFAVDTRSIQIEDADLAIISKNWIHDCLTSYESVYLSNVDSSIVSFNLIENMSMGFTLNSCSHALISDNTIQNLNSKAIIIDHYNSDIQILRNRISGIQNFDAIFCYHTTDLLICNNFIQLSGIQQQYGINLFEYMTNAKIYHNSINVGSTNINSAAIFLAQPGVNTIFRNNILANFGGGSALILGSANTGFDSDYNDYYSINNSLIRHAGLDYAQLSDWQTFSGLDPNSLNYNPLYISDTNLRPQQREINGAGVALLTVPFDIDNQIRDENSPDMGADEFTIDFGILELVEPTLNCYLTSNDSIVVLLKQFGDVPLINIEIAYQVNNGLIFYDTVPGAIDNDVVFTFSATQNLISYGSYVFKIWLINELDDNINNDTLTVYRYSSELPHLTVGYLPGCANLPTQFFSTGTLQSGIVDYFYWDFGDGQTSVGQNPTHTYDSSGIYLVHLYGFTTIGCYNDTSFYAQIFYTPIANFTASSICLGDTMLLTNESTVSQGSLSYSWDFGDGQVSQLTSPTHLFGNGGIYGIELVATAQNGCSDTITKYFQVMPPPILNFIGLPGLICNADPAFIIQTNPTGGTLTGNGILGGTFYPSLAGLGSTLISYEYTNNSGCTNSISNSISVVGSPEIHLSTIAPVACKGDSTGILEVGITAGTSANYSILWSNGFTGSSMSDLTAGPYSITVADQNSCKDSATYFIQEPLSVLDLKITKTNATCFEATNGTLYAQAMGGNAPYPFYHWSNGSASQYIMNLPTGPYTVTVLDALGCSFSKTDTIKEPPQISLSFAVQDAVCNGEASGIITPTVTNTISFPIVYQWSNGASTEILNGVPEGFYFLTVTDAHNCTFSDSTYISQPPPWVVYSTIDSTLCYGSSDGAIYLMPTGSNPPFTDFLWESGIVDSFLTHIPAGYYSVTITDHLNCTFTDSFLVEQPDSLVLNFNVQNNVCYGDALGAIDMFIDGGSGQYPVIYWSSGAVSEDINALTAGIYTVTISDSHHCSTIQSTVVGQPDSISLSLQSMQVNCFGDETGSVQSAVQGGTYPYSFEWSNGLQDDHIEGLATGAYFVTITDSYGCTKMSEAFVPTASEMDINLEIVNPSCMFSSDASILCSTFGGLPPYTYSWSTGDNLALSENLPPGQYQVTITDSSYCERAFAMEIFRPTTICIDPPLLFSPNNDGINDYWMLDGLEWTPLALVTIFDRWGKIVFKNLGGNCTWDGRFNGEPLPSDAYFWVIDFGNGYPPVSGKLTLIY